MNAVHSSGFDHFVETPDERRSGVVLETAPHRRFFDNKLNQLKWPLFVFAWFLVGLAIVGYFLIE